MAEPSNSSASNESSPNTLPSKLKSFWGKYRLYILISLGIYVLLTIVMLAFSSGPQDQPFIYQIF